MATILVIDDDVQICRLIRLVLEAAGYSVREATGGAEGIALYGDAPADVVLCDLQMPGVDGLTTMRALRRLDANARIIAMTGGILGGLDPPALAQQAGAVRTLTKPFDVNTLRKVIQDVLAR
jgi:CheY-like chemotaxis protein